jgi:hypothetical protein
MTGSLSGIDLYWLPLGAGGHSVRLNGLVFEGVVARLERRTACDLYHSALEVRAPSGRLGIPVRDGRGIDGGRRSFAPSEATRHADLQGFNGSDGTRTRDLRRDRHVPGKQRLATIDAQSLY